MKHSDLITTLNRLASELLGNFEYINNGGCGVIAAMVGKELERMGVVCDVTTPEYGVEAARIRAVVTDRWSVDDWDANGLSRGHLVIRFKVGPFVRLWDTDNGVVSTLTRWGMGHKGFGLGLSVQECAWLSESGEGWNDTFDRDQIPDMQDAVDQHLGGFPDKCFSGIQGNRILQFLLARSQYTNGTRERSAR